MIKERFWRFWHLLTRGLEGSLAPALCHWKPARTGPGRRRKRRFWSFYHFCAKGRFWSFCHFYSLLREKVWASLSLGWCPEKDGIGPERQECHFYSLLLSSRFRHFLTFREGRVQERAGRHFWDQFLTAHDLVAAKTKLVIGDTIMASEGVLRYFTPFLHVWVFSRFFPILPDSVTFGQPCAIQAARSREPGMPRMTRIARMTRIDESDGIAKVSKSSKSDES